MRLRALAAACLLFVAGFADPAAASATTTRPAAPVAATGGLYRPVASTRVLDTRATHALAAGSVLTFPVAGQGAVAAGAGAVSANVTVLSPSKAGSVSVFPGGTAWNGSASISFPAGTSAQNMLTTQLGTDGSLSLRNNLAVAVQLIVDVTGYYTGGAVGVAGAYQAIVPQRPYDARQAPTHVLAANSVATFAVAGTGALPTNATAVELNLTVLAPPRAGSVSVFPGTTWNGSATASFPAVVNVQHMLTEGLNPDGVLSVRNNTPAGLAVIVDVVGYYLAGKARLTGAYVPVPMTRVLDSRLKSPGQYPIGSGGAATFPTLHAVAGGGTSEIPVSGVSAVTVNVTVVTPALTSSIAVYPGDTSWNGSATMSFATGQSQQSMLAIRVGVDGTLAVHSNESPNHPSSVSVIADVYGYFLGEPNPYSAGTGQQVDPVNGGADHVSCTSATFCLASNDAGNLSSYDGAAWSAAGTVPAVGTVADLSCATEQFCVAVGSNSQLAMYDGTSWRVGGTDPNWNLTAVSCPTTTFCAAVDTLGGAVTYDGTGWSNLAYASGSTLTDVSCPAAGSCVAVGPTGYRISVLSDGRWSMVDAGTGNPHRVACATVDYCLLGYHTQGSDDYRAAVWNSQAIVPVPATQYQVPVALACPAAGRCVGITPAAEVGWDDAGWTAPIPSLAASTEPADISCPTTSFCMAVTNGVATPLTAG